MVHSPSVRPLPALGFALVLVCAAPPQAIAQEPAERGWNFELALGAEMLDGHTTYRIEASDGVDSIASELEFPLEGLAARVQAELATRGPPGEGRFVFRVAALKDLLHRGAGTMKDSDWLSDSIDVAEVGAPHPGKDIYSESDAELDAIAVEGSVAWELESAPGLSVAPMIGVLYQRFEYDVRNVQQVGYGPYAAGLTGFVPGSVLDYRISYRAPYVGARGALSRRRFTATADAWYSPIASAEDRDDHLLRGKLSTTRADGSAWQAGVGARLELGPGDFVEVRASTMRVRATGLQHQRFYAGESAGMELAVPSTITSTRNSVAVDFVHRY